MMGSSVNLAARLMGKCEGQQILVDNSVYAESHDDFIFETLQPIEAKGYSELVSVYSPTGYSNTESTLEDLAKRSNTIKQMPVVGRAFELNILNNALEQYAKSMSTAAPSEGIEKLDSSLPSNKFVVVGGPGSGVYVCVCCDILVANVTDCVGMFTREIRPPRRIHETKQTPSVSRASELPLGQCVRTVRNYPAVVQGLHRQMCSNRLLRPHRSEQQLLQ